MENDSASLSSTAPTFPLARLAQLAMILGAVLASGATAVALRVIRNQASNVEWVSHTLEVRQKLAMLRATVRGAGSGIRVYLLTHSDSYLDSYRDAAKAIPEQLAELEALTSDNPVQRENLAQLRPLVELRLHRLDLYLHGQEATVDWLDETKRNLDEIQRAADRIDAEEVRLLELRKLTAHRGQVLAELVATLGLLLSLALVAIGWTLQQHEQRHEAELIQLLHVGSLVSNNANNFEDALQACLERVCEVTGWPGGHVHAVEGDELVSMGIWRLPPNRELNGLREKIESFRAPRDIGIAGQLLGLQRPGWIRLGSRPRGDENPIRDAVSEAGFKGFLAVPVVTEGEVPAIIEFFVDKPLRPDSTFLEAIASVGAQLGRVHERGQVLGLMEKHAEEIQALSITDELTGLLNRRGFIALADQQLRVSSRNRERCCLFFMDMDGLKAINDQLGHGEGDLALCRLAEILEESFREADLVARLGGDEFVALAVDATNANGIADRIQQNLSGKFMGEKLQLPIAVSIGMSWIEPGQDVQIEVALATADAAMYARKRARRDSKPPLAVAPV